MFRYLFLFLLLLGTTSIGVAQTKDCEETLRTAQQYYNKGQLNKIVWTLNDCYLNNNLPRSLRKEILILLADTHKHLNQDELALERFEEILRIDPFYEPPLDNYELRSLDKQLVRYAKTSFGAYGGFVVGIHPTILQANSADNISILEETYQLDSTGRNSFSFTGFFDYRFKEKSLFDITGSVNWTRLQYNYTARRELSAGIDTLSIYERMDRLGVSLGLNYSFINPRKKAIKTRFVPFVFGRIGVNMFLKSSRFHQITVLSDDTNLFNTSVENDNIRSQFSMYTELGGGLKIKLSPRWYIQPSVTYTYWMGSLSTDQDNRPPFFSQPQVNHIENEFALGLWQINFGGGMFLYKSRRK